MGKQTTHTGPEAGDPPAATPADPGLSASEPDSRRAPGGGGYEAARRAERRRRRMRLAANLMIASALVGIVAIVLYFVATWLYTSRQQDALFEELAAENPDMATAEQTVSEDDYIDIGVWDGGVADTAARLASEAEHQAQLLQLSTAADEYLKQIRGQVGKAIGRIVIPGIAVDSVMIEGNFQGFSESYLRKGPGHWPETPLPGMGGSVVISGHRSTYGAPFRKLDELAPGDEIQLVMPYAIVRYKVTQVIIVLPDEVQTVADRGKEQVSLVACHPVYSAKERIIAQADLDSFALLEGER